MQPANVELSYTSLLKIVTQLPIPDIPKRLYNLQSACANWTTMTYVKLNERAIIVPAGTAKMTWHLTCQYRKRGSISLTRGYMSTVWPACYVKKKYLLKYYNIKNIYSFYTCLTLFNIFFWTWWGETWMSVGHSGMVTATHLNIIYIYIYIFFFRFFVACLVTPRKAQLKTGCTCWKAWQ